jgi:hypothetical protein
MREIYEQTIIITMGGVRLTTQFSLSIVLIQAITVYDILLGVVDLRICNPLARLERLHESLSEIEGFGCPVRGTDHACIRPPSFTSMSTRRAQYKAPPLTKQGSQEARRQKVCIYMRFSMYK